MCQRTIWNQTMKELWVEKYRPKTVDGYVFRDDHQRKQINTWIKEKSIPHLLFSGSAGIGKTTLAKMLINEIGIEDYDVLEINASRENSVDVIRDKITNFVQMIPFGPFKVVLLDEADYLTLNAQAILRGLMETYASTSRFILTCNYPNKIIPALHSRCQGFHVEKTDQTEYTARVATILVEENIEFDLDTLDLYVRVAYPDLRKCIQLVQQNSTEGSLESPNTGDAGEVEWKFDMVALFKAGKITEARKLLCGKVRAEEMEEVYRWLYDNLEVFGDDQKQDSAIIIIKQGLADHTLVVDPEINLAATLVKLARL
jgi:replication factor C small subunit